MSSTVAARQPSEAVSMPPSKSLPVVETAADAFDKDDFDPLRYINEMFPSGALETMQTWHDCCVWLRLFGHTATSAKAKVTLNARHEILSHAETSLVGLDPLIGSLKHRVCPSALMPTAVSTALWLGCVHSHRILLLLSDSTS